jgi:tRNA pseudouridine38-40 synthase
MAEVTHWQNWRVTLAYDGADFHGWQIQPDAASVPTVQSALAAAIQRVSGEAVLPQGAGRTDAGVHALGQVASFRLRAPIPPDSLRSALNRVLPAGILVHHAEHAPEEFHARHSACGKIYRYCVVRTEKCPPYMARYAVACRWPLNLPAMQAAAARIVGEHDFTSFAAADPDRSMRTDERTPAAIRRIDLSTWEETSTPAGIHDDGQPMLYYTVQGSGFLHHMVRNLAGTFLEVGRGAIPPDAVRDILAARDRRVAGPTAPPNGLYLVRVLYPESTD